MAALKRGLREVLDHDRESLGTFVSVNLARLFDTDDRARTCEPSTKIVPPPTPASRFRIVDVREILDGKVWPRDVHDFVGGPMEILDEQMEDASDADRADAVQQLTGLFADDDILIRTYAVLSSRHVIRILGPDALREAVAAHASTLEVKGAPVWQHRCATLDEEIRQLLNKEVGR